MRKISKENTIKSFYYLMAVDGQIGEDELQKFYEFGNAIDDSFGEKKDWLINECKNVVEQSLQDSDAYTFILNSFRETMNNGGDSNEEIVSSRLMIWDLFIMGYANGLLTEKENSFIHEVASLCEVNDSVVLEMEQLCNTYADIQKEMDWIKGSDLKYSEVEFLLKGMEEKQKTIFTAAKNLIEDEIYSPDAAFVGELESGVARDILNACDDVVEKVGSAIEDTYNNFMETEAGKKVAEFGEQAGAVVQDTFNSIKDSETGKKVTELGEQAGAAVQDTLNNIKESEAAKNVSEFSEQAGKAIQDTGEKVVAETKEKMSKLFGGISKKFGSK